MHPEVVQNKPGTCPKCGSMKLVLAADALIDAKHASKPSYAPLLVVVGLITLTTAALSCRDFLAGIFSVRHAIQYFMTGFFLVFAGFKLMDLKGFASGYATYDLLASRWYIYGYIYPFIELFFGLAMIVGVWERQVLFAEMIVMTFGGLGVAQKLWRREKFECACLGTVLKVPLTKVTLVEDFGMATLAAIALYIHT